MAGLTKNEAERKVRESMSDAKVKVAMPGFPATRDKRWDAVQQFGLWSGVSATSERKSWSYEDLVGLTAEEAGRKIKEHMPHIRLVQVVRPGHLVTCDYRRDRVRLQVNFLGRVIRTPRPG